MKKILLGLLAFISVSVYAQTSVHYGYTPDQLVAEEIQAQGTGENSTVAGMICLDPTTDPVMQRLKGHQVKGVRCYLRAEYAQKRQKRSYVMHTLGDVNAESTKTMCDFDEGWNEILFDEPVTIGDEKIFLGLQVYETRSVAYPLVSYAKASVPGGAWINLKGEGWKSFTDRGTLFIQAILDDAAGEKLQKTVYAQAASWPRTVAPSRMFDAQVYFLNHSAEEVQSVTLSTLGQGDTEPEVREITFDTPIPAYGGRTISMPLRAGAETGTAQWLRLNVTHANGVPTQQAAAGENQLYVTHDAFLRIPLVEEFTSQLCTNCPFMIYYLDKAMEEFPDPVLYVTHHTGYQKDAFTLPMDEDLLYLFGSDYTYNPAVMYDRRVAKGEEAPIFGASEASTAPYLAALTAAVEEPAMAEVLVDVDKTADAVACHVHGRINSEMAASGTPLYLSVYLVENGLPTDKYVQLGLDDEGAPADIKERFRHNGIKRHVFNTQSIGDPLTVNADNTFSVEFPAAAWNADWVWDNCQVIAFVHKVDKENMTQNEVLNAGSNKLNHLINGIDGVRADAATQVCFKVDARGMLQANLPVQSVQVYDLSGKGHSAQQRLNKGVYVVRYTLHNGESGTQKVMVK